MKQITVNTVARSMILAAVVMSGHFQASTITTAQGVLNGQSKFQKQINSLSSAHVVEQNSINDQFAIRAEADKKIAAQEAAKKAAEQKKAEEAKQAAEAKAEAQRAADQRAADQRAAQVRPTSYQVNSAASSGSYGVTGNASKEWIKSIESGGNPNAANGQYQGLFQMGSQAAASYGGYSGSAADRYVAARYGSWEAAAEHHRIYGWY
ncbi:hypothetical protein [Oenococcus kitaharae]|nr:hypothetical protein [Oenococcus kitaharae]